MREIAENNVGCEDIMFSAVVAHFYIELVPNVITKFAKSSVDRNDEKN